MNTAIIYTGKKYDICSIIHGGRSYVMDFIENLQQADQKKIMALLKRTADFGKPANEELFRKLKDTDIWEFKRFRIRVFCFFDKGNLIILTHGFNKKSNSTPRNEIEKAIRLKKEYLEGKKGKK